MTQIDPGFFLSMELDVVSNLMKGNESQCFATRQFANACDQWIANFCNCTLEELLSSVREVGEDDTHYIATARTQLEEFPLVNQVSPDVWTATEDFWSHADA